MQHGHRDMQEVPGLAKRVTDVDQVLFPCGPPSQSGRRQKSQIQFSVHFHSQFPFNNLFILPATSLKIRLVAGSESGLLIPPSDKPRPGCE